MCHRALILAAGLCLAPSWGWAQTTFTTKDAVVIHKAPTTSSPVVGHAPGGTALELTRDVGDWAQVAWPASPDRTGYVRVRLGAVTLAAFRGLNSIRPAAGDRAALATGADPSASSVMAVAVRDTTPETAPARETTARSAVTYDLPPHTMGFGLRMDPRFRSFGVAARLWSRSRVGAQLELTRTALTGDLSSGRLTTYQVSPAVLYALPDAVGGSVWLRPYVGSGLELTRSTFTSVAPVMHASDTAFGMKVFGGAEATFPGAPQVAVSADLGYHWLESSFSGFELGALRASLSAHWYVR
jgi:hypothetical protein